MFYFVGKCGKTCNSVFYIRQKTRKFDILAIQLKIISAMQEGSIVLTGGEKILIVLLILLLVAVFTDYYSDKIPNRLIVAGILIGIVTTKDLGGGILQLLAVCICFFPFFSIGALGAGDVKCIAMTGLFLQQELLLQSILYTFIIAAIFSLVKLWFSRKKVTKSETVKTHTIHLALPIFLGVLLAVGGTYL